MQRLARPSLVCPLVCALVACGGERFEARHVRVAEVTLAHEGDTHDGAHFAACATHGNGESRLRIDSLGAGAYVARLVALEVAHCNALVALPRQAGHALTLGDGFRHFDDGGRNVHGGAQEEEVTFTLVHGTGDAAVLAEKAFEPGFERRGGGHAGVSFSSRGG